MSTMVKQFIDGCTACQQMKPNTHPTAEPLMPIKSHAHRPFQQITMDFITNLPLSDGFDSIFIMVNQGLTKGVILMPCNKTITAAETADLYIKNVFMHYGLPVGVRGTAAEEDDSCRHGWRRAVRRRWDRARWRGGWRRRTRDR